MCTAYDYPSAVHVARAGIDIVLVGDSVAMVELGYETTQQMEVSDMIHHCKAVKRGLDQVGNGSMLVGDMPFGTYEYEDTDVALKNAYRFVKEGGCDAVKLEGGSKIRANAAKKIVEGGGEYITLFLSICPMKKEWIVLTSSYACSCSHGTCWIDASSYKVRIFLIPQISSLSNFCCSDYPFVGLFKCYRWVSSSRSHSRSSTVPFG